MTAGLKLYTFAKSGHAHRAVLFASLLGLKVERIEVDLTAGAQKAPEHLRLHPFGQVPVLRDGDQTIWDSNAVLVHLAGKFDPAGTWLPKGKEAIVQAWLSVASGALTDGPCDARRVTVFGAELDHERACGIAAGLFEVLDARLSGRAFLIADAPTIADVALYTYTAHAPEGGISLDPYPDIRAWLVRMEALPGFVAMPASKAGLLA
ncbi:glutathione S-transferase family protein [Rhizobiales bacterium]|uniref:glutathione S-transferase family protein n=1 Tax=Hongsoonwoonella zoysiae TaxID=2821844 RepID=UPI001560BCD1|nr:glutathione S-transferase [Hongsoonwoonella zoysiae]NRG17489.1 glutathione S-transferase family protein [Hongsoonwoonella zoysiae]